MTAELEQRLRDALHEDADRAQLVNPGGPPAPEARPLTVGRDRRPSARKLLAVAAAIALVVSAGVAVIVDRDRPPRVTSGVTQDPGDQAVADGAVLTPDDMEFWLVGWEAAPPEVAGRWQTERDELDQAFADCLDTNVSELRHDSPTAASAFLNSYERNDERLVSEVTVLPSAVQAAAVIDRYRDDVAQRCYLDGVEQKIADAARAGLTTISGDVLSGDDLEIGESTITEVYLEYEEAGLYKAIGDDAIGFRIKVPLSSEGVEVDVFAVVAFVREGRALVETSFQTYFTPFWDGGTSTGLAPRTAVLLTKEILDRIPAATSYDPSDTVRPPGEGEDPPGEGEDPLALPDAGEQPADPVAAEEQVRAAYLGLFDASLAREERAQFVERPEVWLPANQALVEGEYGEAVRDQRSEVEAVVFTSPTRAAVRFRLVATDEQVPQGYQVGDAVLVDGRWVVAITTPCDLVSPAGVQCDLSP